MGKQRKEILGDTFIKKILQGERDFRDITLETGYDFHSDKGCFEELNTYLRTQNLKEILMQSSCFLLNGLQVRVIEVETSQSLKSIFPNRSV